MIKQLPPDEAAEIAHHASVMAGEIIGYVMANSPAENLPFTLIAALCMAIIKTIEQHGEDEKMDGLEAAIGLLRDTTKHLGWGTA